MAKLEVGQKLWCVPPNSRDKPLWVVVESVGRKWATVGYKRRIDVNTLKSEPTGCGRGIHGTYYLAKEEWDAKIERDKAIGALRNGVHRTLSIWVTTDAIYQAAALLGVEMPERASAGAPDKGGENEPA